MGEKETGRAEGERRIERERERERQREEKKFSAPKSLRYLFLRFVIAMPLADPRNRIDFPRQEKAMLHCDLRVRWKVASDLRFRAAISEPKTPFFLRDFWRFGSANAEIVVETLPAALQSRHHASLPLRHQRLCHG